MSRNVHAMLDINKMMIFPRTYSAKSYHFSVFDRNFELYGILQLHWHPRARGPTVQLNTTVTQYTKAAISIVF